MLAAASWLGLDSLVADARASQRNWSFTCLVWWDLVCLTTYFVLPALVVRFILKEPLHKYGIKGAGAFAGFPIYMGMLAVVMPFVILVSFGKGFQETYPFYKIPAGEPLGVDFLCWELLYAMQFVALEFFFRGFLVQGLRHRFGVDAVLVMMVPYCMIHFGKPMPETFAAIVAGIALGLMSFRTRLHLDGGDAPCDGRLVDGCSGAVPAGALDVRISSSKNPKSESRNPKQIQNSESQCPNRTTGLVLVFWFCDLDLFRISDFGFTHRCADVARRFLSS